MKDFLVFVLGIAIGFCLVQGLAFVQQNYVWALFYR